MERNKMKKKGFTLVELLVVIAIIAMLLAILMPALGKVRQLAQRLVCGTNLAGIGKAMLVYSNDDKYESYPIAGKTGAVWGAARGTGGSQANNPNTFDWKAKVFTDTNPNPTSSVSASFFLLVKYADVGPDSFICSGSDLKKFELSKYNVPTSGANAISSVTEVWDFGIKADEVPTGARAGGHVSYAYQLPMKVTAADTAGPYPITTTSNPGMAVAADRNPFWTSVMGAGTTARIYIWDTTNRKVLQGSWQYGNSTYHQKDGQNVLFADSHTEFKKSANCGVDSDNIYTVWGKATVDPTSEEQLRQCGKGATTGSSTTDPATGAQMTGLQSDNTYYPMNSADNYLVCEVDKS